MTVSLFFFAKRYAHFIIIIIIISRRTSLVCWTVYLTHRNWPKYWLQLTVTCIKGKPAALTRSFVHLVISLKDVLRCACRFAVCIQKLFGMLLNKGDCYNTLFLYILFVCSFLFVCTYAVIQPT